MTFNRGFRALLSWRKDAGGGAMERPNRGGMVFYGLMIAFFSLVIWAISRYRRA